MFVIKNFEVIEKYNTKAYLYTYRLLDFSKCGFYSPGMKFDLHVHTSISPCSRLGLQELLDNAGRSGLDGVCITDHNTMAMRNYLREGIQENGLCIILGMEYSTSKGDFLIFGPFEELRPDLGAEELLSHVNRTGGVAIAAHPFRSGRSTDESVVRHRLCTIVEGVNGRNNNYENGLVTRWQSRYGVKTVGGSDAHSLEELGRVTTCFREPVRDRATFVNALLKGRWSIAAQQNYS